MKRWTALLLAMVLIVSLVGCGFSLPDGKHRVLDAMEGHWHSGGTKLFISGKRAEATSSYELDGRTMTGETNRGTIKVRRDGTFTIDMNGDVREGHVTDHGTLVIGEKEYIR